MAQPETKYAVRRYRSWGWYVGPVTESESSDSFEFVARGKRYVATVTGWVESVTVARPKGWARDSHRWMR